MKTVNRTWLLLIVTLPGQKASLRVRLWRALKSSGAADLRDGVYILPLTPSCRKIFEGLQTDFNLHGGESYLLEVTTTEVLSDTFRSLFNRDGEYQTILDEIEDTRKHLNRNVSGSWKRIREIRKRYEALTEIDFFPRKLSGRCREILEIVEKQAARNQTPGEPASVPGTIQNRERSQYRNRLWATRRHLWVDRMASAWLIRRFIDPDAQFAWIKEGSRKPKDSLGFDYDGADFTHTETTVTFETMMLSFIKDPEPALIKLGRLVHFLDVGGPECPGAEGIEMVLEGIRKETNDDDKALAKAMIVFDALLEQLRSKSAKRSRR